MKLLVATFLVIVSFVMPDGLGEGIKLGVNHLGIDHDLRSPNSSYDKEIRLCE